MKNIAIFIVSGIIATVLFELFLRFSPFTYGVSPAVYDKDIGMWHKRSFTGEIIKPCYRQRYYFDARGLIVNSYDYDDTKKDILLFGDSYIEALMVENKNIIHNALYRVYQGKYNFINYGLSDTSAMQQLVIMQKKGDFSHAKSVIQFIRIESDIYDVDSKNRESSERPLVFLKFKSLDDFKVISPQALNYKEKLRDILGNFELYIYIKKSLYFIKNKLFSTKTQKTDYVIHKDLSNNWLQLEGSIYQTQKFLKAKGLQYIVLLYGKDQALNNRLKDFLKAQKITFYDLISLSKQEGLKLKGFSCDSHWTDQTHLNVAQLIKKNDLLSK